MTQDLEGAADALDASVSQDPPVEIPGPDARSAADAAIAACEAKVEKQRAHLAGAEQALAEAREVRTALGEE